MKPGRCLVIGGGVAGAAAAIALAGAGRETLLVERDKVVRDKVCGEFLSAEALGYLEQLGVDPFALGAVPITALRLVAGHAEARIALPFAAASLSRRRLDGALLDRAAALGAEIWMGARVQKLTEDRWGWQAKLQDGGAATGQTIFGATGKHDLRGRPRPGRDSGLVAMKQHLVLAKAEMEALSGHVELILFRGGYAGLEPVEGGRANLCLVIRQRHLRALTHAEDGWLGALGRRAPHLARRLAGATPCTKRPLSVANLPYGLLRRDGDGLWLLGDQAAVIPSLTGDGMSIALHSALAATRLFLEGKEPTLFQRQLAKELARPMRTAQLVAALFARPILHRPLVALAGAAPSLAASLAQATRIPAESITVRAA